MNFSNETQEKIKHFAKEQSRNYLEEAEMTYMEKLRRKSDQAKDKVGVKLSRFKGRSDKGLEAQNDLELYMSDYIDDLISQGLTEQEAFEKASETLKFNSGSEQAAHFNERLWDYIENRDPAEQEAIGAFYGGFILIAMVAGGLIGFLSSGGRESFLAGGWIDMVIGVGVGLLAGVGLGLISHGIIIMREKGR